MELWLVENIFWKLVTGEDSDKPAFVSVYFAIENGMDLQNVHAKNKGSDRSCSRNNFTFLLRGQFLMERMLL